MMFAWFVHSHGIEILNVISFQRQHRGGAEHLSAIEVLCGSALDRDTSIGIAADSVQYAASATT
jgi:hypothetical protein